MPLCFRRPSEAAWRSVNLYNDTGRLEEINLESHWKQNSSLKPVETTSTPKHLRCWLSEKTKRCFHLQSGDLALEVTKSAS